jgi:hypothetical protein
MKKIVSILFVALVSLVAPKALALNVSSYSRSSFGTDNDAGMVYAQSFLVGQTGTLTEVALNLVKIGNPKNISVRIMDDSNGFPGTTTVVSSTIIPGNVSSTSSDWVGVTFPTNPILSANTHYWIVVQCATTGDTNDGYDTYLTPTNVYPDGVLLTNKVPFNPSTDYMGPWDIQATADLLFKVTLSNSIITVPLVPHAPVQDISNPVTILPAITVINDTVSVPPTSLPPATISILKPGLVANVQVKDIQQKLKDLKIFNGPVSGNYGLLTKAAVKKFQKDNNLKVDGIVGPKTLYVINKKTAQ